MKKLYKEIEIIFILLSLCFPVLIVLNIWDIVTGALFFKCIFTNMILWITFLIAGVLKVKIEESENEIK